MTKDSFYMKKALSLAEQGAGYTSPNPMVGAVVVKDDNIIGQGYHQQYGGPHAEVNALNEAVVDTTGATLYVNLEPCSHYGKTPPCALKIIKAGIKKVFIAMKDPNPLVAGRGIELLEKEGIEVEVGLLAEEARQLNEVFIKYITTDLPYIYLKTAQTLDGFIAANSGDSKWITNKKARLFGHKLRQRVDAILVGIGTILKDNPRLTTRLPDKKGKDSVRIVLDSNLRIPVDARIINQDSPVPTIIVTGKRAVRKKQELEKKDKVELLTFPLNENGRIPLEKLLSRLHDRGISSILVEGGSRVNSSFINSGLIDKIYTFIAPKIMGGGDGIPVFAGKGPDSMTDVITMRNIDFKVIDDNILVTGELREVR